MEWLERPPCTEMSVKISAPRAGRLELTGPSKSARVKSGTLAAFGATFGAFALPFLRAPVPAPFKVIPALFGAVGAGLTALGAAAASMEISVLFERGKGVRFRWKYPVLEQREIFVPMAEIADFEVVRTEQTIRTDSDRRFGGSGSTIVRYELVLVTKAGKALGIEEFSLNTQAKLRQEQIEEVLRRGKAEEKPKPRQQRGRRKASGER
jgi:hypothetical protein